MTYRFDPELVPIMAAQAERSAEVPVPARDDWKAVRATATAGLSYMATLVPPSTGVRTATYVTKAQDGADLELRWYTEEGSSQGSAVVYAHGGGMVAGSLDLYDEMVSWYVSQTGVPLAKQLLVYPMLDDRNIDPGPIPAAMLTWSYDNNFTCWNAALGDRRDTACVSPVAAPARLTDFTALAAASSRSGTWTSSAMSRLPTRRV